VGDLIANSREHETYSRVASTPGFVLSDSTQFHSYATPAKARKNGNPVPPKELLLHSASHRTMDYTAREDHPKGLLNHYVGVFDPATGELQIVEARKMTVRSTVRSRKAADEALTQPTEKKACIAHSKLTSSTILTIFQTMMALRNELGQTFGTKKAKKALESMAQNAILSKDWEGMDEADRALMDSIKESATAVATREELQALTDLARPVPRGNYDADTIQDVYNPEEIIGTEVLNAIPIQDWQDKAEKSEPLMLSSRFVANRINKVAGGPSAVARLRLLRYLYFVLVFWKATTTGKVRGTRRLPKKDQLRKSLEPAPGIVIENIRRKFSDAGTMQHIDLLMTHCCVFACLIDHFEVDTADIRDDLTLEAKEIGQYFNEIGAKSRPLKRGNRTVHVATLALPLQLPKLRHVRQANRR